MGIRNRTTTLVTAGAAALLIAVAPAAAADTEPIVTELSPEMTMTQTTGSTSMHAHPQTHDYPALAYRWHIFG